MAIITEPNGGWSNYSELYEFYSGSGNVPTVLSFSFGYTLEPTEILTSVELSIDKDIVSYGSTVNGLSVTSKIVNYFGDSAIYKIRDRTTLQISSVVYSELPDPTTCDVIELIPPQSMVDSINYTVTLKYIDALGVSTTINRVFNQMLYGTYSAISNAMIEYINSSE